MEEIKQTAFYITFTFINGIDIISYHTRRTCHGLDEMIGYCDKLIYKFGDKYGDIAEIEIYKRENGVYSLVYDKVLD